MKEYNYIKIFGTIFLLGGILLIGIHKYQKGLTPLLLAQEYYANLACELLSIAATILLIDYFYEKKEISSNKKRLIRELGSEYRGFTGRALKEIKELGYLADGSLRNADLSKADLGGLDLSNADLKGANLEGANLDKSILKNANLQGAILNNATLLEANLENCTLVNAQMRKCNLYAAVMNRCTLKNTDLAKAKLERCELIEAIIEDSKLEDVVLKLAILTRSKIKNCTLLRSDWHSMTTKDTRFERCNFQDIKNWDQILESETIEFIAPLNPPQGFTEKYK